MTMDEFPDAIWAEVAAETAEHLGMVELLLVAAERHGADASDVAQLFRSFHTIKGTAATIGLHGVATLAHHAEDLLSLVRDGRATLGEQAIAALLATVDDLRSMVRDAVASRRDVPASGPLIPRLRALAAPAAKDPAARKTRIEQLLPVIGRAATAESTDAAVRREAAEAAEALAELTAAMGIPDLLPTVRSIREALNAPLNRDAKAVMIEALARFRSELDHLEGRAEAGLRLDFGDRLCGALGGEVKGILSAMGTALDTLSGPSPDIDAAAEEVAALARSASSFFIFLDLPHACRLALIVQDVFGRIAAGEMQPYPKIIRLARSAIDQLSETTRHVHSWQDLDRKTVDDILDNFRQVLLQDTTGAAGNDLLAALKRVLAEYDISPALVEILSADNIQNLVTVTRHGRNNIYEILADLEGSEQLALNFITWLKGETTAVTNRTVFHDGRTLFEFLVVSHLSPTEIAGRIKAIDPGGAAISMRACRAKEGAAETGGSAASRRPAESGVRRVRGGTPSRTATFGRLVAEMEALCATGDIVRQNLSGADTRNALTRLGEYLRSAAAPAEARQWLKALETAHGTSLAAATSLDAAARRFRSAVADLRTVPLDVVFGRLHPVVLEVGRISGRQVLLDVAGGEVRVDRNAAERLHGLLEHLIRNGDKCCAEPAPAGTPARMRLKAEQREHGLKVRFSLHGRDLDIERVTALAAERAKGFTLGGEPTAFVIGLPPGPA